MRSKVFLGLILAGLVTITACHDDGNGSSEPIVEAEEEVILDDVSGIAQINNNRQELKMANGDTLLIANSTIFRRRASCSGFNVASVNDIDKTDIVEYFFFKSEANFARREITPFEIRAERLECIEALVNTIQDTDKDQVGDVVDNCPLTPNSQQLDDDNDGVGNACDAEPNNPEVQ